MRRIHGRSPRNTESQSYHSKRFYPPSYLGGLLLDVLANMTPEAGLTRDQALAKHLGLSQTVFSSYKKHRQIMPLEIAEKLRGVPGVDPAIVPITDEALLAWHEADIKLRDAWRSEGKRKRLLLPQPQPQPQPQPTVLPVQAPQPVRPVSALPVVMEQTSYKPVVTLTQAISQETASRRAEAWIRQVFGVSGSFKEATRTARITRIDFEGLHAALVNLLLEESK